MNQKQNNPYHGIPLQHLSDYSLCPDIGLAGCVQQSSADEVSLGESQPVDKCCVYAAAAANAVTGGAAAVEFTAARKFDDTFNGGYCNTRFDKEVGKDPPDGGTLGLIPGIVTTLIDRAKNDCHANTYEDRKACLNDAHNAADPQGQMKASIWEWVDATVALCGS